MAHFTTKSDEVSQPPVASPITLIATATERRQCCVITEVELLLSPQAKKAILGWAEWSFKYYRELPSQELFILTWGILAKALFHPTKVSSEELVVLGRQCLELFKTLPQSLHGNDPEEHDQYEVTTGGDEECWLAVPSSQCFLELALTVAELGLGKPTVGAF